MSDAPERIWAHRHSGIREWFSRSFPGPQELGEYLRLDLHTAALAEPNARIAALEAGLLAAAQWAEAQVQTHRASGELWILPQWYDEARALLDGGKP